MSKRKNYYIIKKENAKFKRKLEESESVSKNSESYTIQNVSSAENISEQFGCKAEKHEVNIFQEETPEGSDNLIFLK